MNTASDTNHFAVAPWPTALKLISFLGTGALVGAGYAAYRAIPTPSGFTHAFGLGVALVFPAIAVVALLFMVTGYHVSHDALCVQRPLWSTHISLVGLASVGHDATVCRRSLRVFGNGGLYSFTGVYWNRTLGRFRLFATDLRRAVVLEVQRQVVVVTPAEPDALVAYLGQLFPGARRSGITAPSAGEPGGGKPDRCI